MPLRRGRLGAGRSSDRLFVVILLLLLWRPCLRGPRKAVAGVSGCFRMGNDPESRRPSGVPKNNVKADEGSPVSGWQDFHDYRSPKMGAMITYISQLILNRIELQAFLHQVLQGFEPYMIGKWQFSWVDIPLLLEFDGGFTESYGHHRQ